MIRFVIGLFVLFSILSCNGNNNKYVGQTTVDSIKLSNYSKYTCGIDKRTITYYLSLSTKIDVDTIVLETGNRQVELKVNRFDETSSGWRYTLEYNNKDYELLSLRKLYERNLDIIKFTNGVLKVPDGKIIDSFSVSSNTIHSYYLNNKKITDPYSKSFEEEVPFIPLEAPKK